MKLNRSVIFGFCLLFGQTSVSISQQPNLDDCKQKLLNMLHFRKSIVTLHVAGIAEGESSSKYRFKAYIDRKNFRNDKELIRFPNNESQVGQIDRVAIVQNDLRRNHSAYGAELNNREQPFNTQINASLLGLSPVPLVFLTPVSTLEKTLVGQISSRIESAEFSMRVIEGTECAVISVAREEGEQISAYFDSTESYRGCEIVSGDYRDWLWIKEVFAIDGYVFPRVFRSKMTKANLIVHDETVVLETVKINEAIDPSTFEFAGLGVANGDSIDVKNGSLGNEPLVVGTYLNGEIIAAVDEVSARNHELAQRRTPQAVVGVAFVIFAVVLIFGLIRKKQ